MINDIITTHSRPSHRPDQHPQLDNSHLATTGQATAIRYTIDDELWKSFTVEQITKQIGLLRETGRFREPNNGDPFTARVSQCALSGEEHYTNQIFYDFTFDGDTVSETLVTRNRRLGSLNWTAEHKQYQEKVAADALWDETILGIWWERDYLCVRCQIPQAECNDEIARMAAYVVVILLQDRTANKIEITPKQRPKLKLNFLQRRPQIPDSENAPEILLTIPRRVYPKTSGKGKGHTPPRMHYRAEHVRRQQYGPRAEPSYREILIAGTWINASDVSPAERGTPITRNYRFKTLRQKQ